jgi:hypothetical protein
MAVAIAGITLLIAIWDSVWAVITFSARPSGYVGGRTGGRILGIGVAIVWAGIGVCFEFKSDAPPRKDPWER